MADSLNSYSTALRLLADGNQDVFRYGLFKDVGGSFYEDPTYLCFTVDIDKDTSALFKNAEAFLEQRGATNSELQARIPVLKEFKDKIVQIFKSQESALDPTEKTIYTKSHYINSISGLNILSKKFVKWKEDKITLELYEDIALFSSYLANLYNNLVYSYENGRQLIPENLLHFDLHIKVSEIRNFTSIAKIVSTDPNDQSIANALKYNVTGLFYTLHDCKFDFFNSRPFEDTMTNGGIGATLPGASVLPLDIFFKSVSRQTYNPLIKSAIAMVDSKIDLGVVIVGYSGDIKENGQATDDAQSSLITGNNEDPYQKGQTTQIGTTNDTTGLFSASGNKKPSGFTTYNTETENNPDADTGTDLSEEFKRIKELQDYNKIFAPSADAGKGIYDKIPDKPLESPNIGFEDVLDDPQAAAKKIVDNQVNRLGQAADNLKAKGNSLIQQQLQRAKNELKRRRNELVRKFVNDVTAKVGVKKIVPDNVYTNSDYYQTLLDRLKSDVGVNLSNEVRNFLTGA